jgi:hypothetical protein
MKNLSLLDIFAGILIWFIISPLISFAEEPRNFTSDLGTGKQIEEIIAEYCQDSPYKSASYTVISDEEYAVYAALVERFFEESDYIGGLSITRYIFPICEGDSQEYSLEKMIPTRVSINLLDNKHEPLAFHFSRVAFSKDHSQAIVRDQYGSFPKIHILINDKGSWKFHKSL